MNNKPYILISILLLCLLQTKGYTQQLSDGQSEIMKQKIAMKLSISEKRADEIQKTLSFNQKEIRQILMSKKLRIPTEMARLKRLIVESREHIIKTLTNEERAKLEMIVPLEVQQRKTVALQNIQMMREGHPSAKKN